MNHLHFSFPVAPPTTGSIDGSSDQVRGKLIKRWNKKQALICGLGIIFGFFFATQLIAEEPESFSIMLSEAEQLALGQALGLKKAETQDLYQEVASSEDQGAVVFLSGIIYLTSEKWALWLNDQVVNNKTSFPGILLKEIQPDVITFTLEGNTQKEIILRLNQSYSYHQKRVIDGDARPREVVSVKN